MALNEQEGQHPPPLFQIAPWRRVKLFFTAFSLFVFGMGPVLILIKLGHDLNQPLTFLGINFFKPWLFGALGGNRRFGSSHLGLHRRGSSVRNLSPNTKRAHGHDAPV
jgi:hypothetical protein